MNRKEWIFAVLCSVGLVALISFYFYNFFYFSEGLKYLEQKKYKEAKKEFFNVLSKKPFLYAARLNLALTHSLTKDFYSSLGEYHTVFTKSPHSTERFESYFNSAHLKALNNDIEGALYDYQQALKEFPESLEVKKNIELLMKKRDNQKKSQKQDEQPQDQKDQQDEKDNQKKDKQQDKQKDNQQKNKEPSKEDLSKEQIQWILEELENRERELRTRLQETNKAPQGKKW